MAELSQVLIHECVLPNVVSGLSSTSDLLGEWVHATPSLAHSKIILHTVGMSEDPVVLTGRMVDGQGVKSWTLGWREDGEDEPSLVSMTTREVTAKAIYKAMRAIDLDQTRLAVRMRALGHAWHRQTAGSVVSGSRRVPVDELLALSLALECSMGQLISPLDAGHINHMVDVGNGRYLPAPEVAESAGVGRPSVLIRWEGDEPFFAGGIFRELAAGVRSDVGKRRAAAADEARLGLAHFMGPEAEEPMARVLARLVEGSIRAQGIDLDDASAEALFESFREVVHEDMSREPSIAGSTEGSGSQKETRS